VPLKSYRTAANVEYDKNSHYNDSIRPNTEDKANAGMKYLNTKSKDHLESKNLPVVHTRFHPLYRYNPVHKGYPLYILAVYIDHCDIDIGLHHIHFVLVHSTAVHQQVQANNQLYHRIFHANRDTTSNYYVYNLNVHNRLHWVINNQFFVIDL
jgi:hypothetical protein